MNEMENKSTEAMMRTGRDLQNPLLNLILAASLLSRLTPGKSHKKHLQLYSAQPPTTFPGQQPIFVYPYDYRLHASLNANQANFPIKQHIIHIHTTPSIKQEQNKDKNDTNFEDHLETANTTQNITQSLEDMINSTLTEVGNEEERENAKVPKEKNEREPDTEELMAAPSNLSEELKQFLVELFKRNFSAQSLMDFKPRPYTESAIKFDIPTTETNEEVTTDTAVDLGTTIFEDTDTEVAESSVDLQAAEANQKRRTRKPDYEYALARAEDDDEDEEDDDLINSNLDIPQKLRVRTTTEASTRRPQKPRVQSTRINSKRPQKPSRRTTPIALIYDDEYDTPATPTPNRKKTESPLRRTNLKKTTTPSSYDFEDDYEVPKRRKTTRRKTTTSAPVYDYDDNRQYQDQYDDQYADDQEEQPLRPTRRPQFQARQTEGTTTTTAATTDTDTGGTETPTMTTTTSTTTMKPASNVTNEPGEYPYSGNNNNNHISFTYGPPVHHHPGYGPSNVNNDMISITYAPPSGQGTGPLLDNWYNQYAKASVYKRIQDLLTPNNYYNQYDVNYNDN